MPYPRGTMDNVWRHVDKATTPDGCWPWTGTVDEHGRTQRVRIGARRTQIARAIVEDTAGAKLKPGTLVTRTCGNTLCCRPEHLTVTAVEIRDANGVAQREEAA